MVTRGEDVLLAVDVGNSNTVLGLWRGDALERHWRLTTRRDSTSDEIALSVRGLLGDGAAGDGASAARVIVASVVPSLRFSLRQALRQIFSREPLFIEPGVRTGMPILYEVPQEVGADRIVNAVAAFEAVGGPCIVVDFGTATTFDVVSARGEYVGGVIAPGLNVSADALYHATAKLPRVEIARPPSAVGRNTVNSMQAGLVFGYAGLVDAIVERIRAEVDFHPRVVGTGGLAPLIARETRTIDECDDMLTLLGLALIYERNR